MKLSIRAMALACSLLWGGALLLVGACNAIWPVYGGTFWDCVASVYPGLSSVGPLLSTILGLVYGLVDGAVAGALLAWLYNAFVEQQR